MHIPALRSADHRDAPLSSTKDGDQLACPLPTLAGSRTSDGWRERYFIRSATISENELVSTPGKWARPDSGPDDPSSRHRHSSKLVTDLGDLRARRYGALSSPAAPRSRMAPLTHA
jgi:hypothetical protein